MKIIKSCLNIKVNVKGTKDSGVETSTGKNRLESQKQVGLFTKLTEQNLETIFEEIMKNTWHSLIILSHVL
jgi:hypothetical protein